MLTTGSQVISFAGMEGDTLSVFLIALAVVAGSIWTLFLNPRIPIPSGSPKVVRFLMEVANDWLHIFGIPAGCFFLPIGSMLVLACLEGGLSFWHWPVALVMFAVLMVWRLR